MTERSLIFATPGLITSTTYQSYNNVSTVVVARYVLPTQCICVFCVDLRTNSDYFTVQH
jgi:hypothetical protein